MELGLRGKRALVTGGTRGIGRAIGTALLREGAALAVCGRSAEGLRDAEAALRTASDGAQVFGTVADVAVPEDAARFVAEAASALGGVDLVVCNVGGTAGGWFEEAGAEDWTRTFGLNLFHSVNTIRAAVPEMRRQGGGSVVLISSISGWKPGSKAQYATAKAAEIQLAASLAPELARDNIRVNTVSPGSIMFEGGGWARRMQAEPERMTAFLRDEFPAGRMGTVEEIADVVCFVLSERARWINGAHIPVDGAQGRPGL
ncbi:SDR family NAD(P)-dependent oxidoreductase [Roseomonas elaeocarpi]|uniref:SDR family NAD(P)-dependent oxidoreductase n=1 Tax=Roseomonas elaeocarpi TaxID=907779 RepID=A0ABV6JWC7_9PROT